MSFIKDYLDNVASGVLNPKGNLGDYSHAANLFVNEQHRLSPKTKYLYSCLFELSNEARQFVTEFDRNPVLLEEFNLLVRQADLPKFSMEVATKNQYNRKKNVQTAIQYDPVNITFHDDSFGVTTALLEGYYRYYYVDGNYTTPGAVAQYDARNLYKGENFHRYRYGLDNDNEQPFFNKITIYQMDRQQWTSYTLVNPVISGIQHETMDSYDASGTSQTSISVVYETVFYDRGSVSSDPPPGIGGSKYDNRPSSLTPAGGGTATLFGLGGVAEGISGVFGDLASGQVGLSTVLETINTYQNAQDLTSQGLRQEGLNILANVSGAAVGQALGGIGNTVFPKYTGNGTVTTNGVTRTGVNLGETLNPNSIIVDPNAVQATAANRTSGGNFNVSDPIYEERIRTAESNNERTGGGG